MISSGVEFTTAATNLVNAIITAVLICVVLRSVKSEVRRSVWSVFLGLFFVICILGAVIHGFVFDDSVRKVLWLVLYGIMAFMIGSFVVAIVYETRGESGLKRVVKINAVLAVAFVISMVIVSFFLEYTFTVFIIYCACYLLVIIGLILSAIRQKAYCGWFLAGVGFMVVGSILQTVKTILLHIGPMEFNYNAVYHVFTILYILCLFVGVMRAEKQTLYCGQS